MKTIMRYGLAPMAIVALALAYTSTVSAHAELESSTPAAGSTVTESPATVTLTFVEEIQKLAGSYSLDVTDANGASVTSGAATVSADGMSLSVALQPDLEHGVYTVSFTNTSAEDGDELSESFTFTIGEAEAPGGDMPDHDDDGHEHDDDMVIAPAPDHGDREESHDEALGEPVTGLVVTTFTPRSGYSISGRLEVLAVDGGSRTQVGVYLSGVGANDSHATHVHMQDTCDEAPGPHAADLPDAEPNGQGGARTIATFDIPFAQVANGQHVVNVHAGPTGGDKAVAACAEIPAVETMPHETPVTLPAAGTGEAGGESALPLLLLGSGFAVLAGGAALRRIAVKV